MATTCDTICLVDASTCFNRRIYFGENVKVSYVADNRYGYEIETYDKKKKLSSFYSRNIINNEITTCPLTKRKHGSKCINCPTGKFRLNQLEQKCKFITGKICGPGFYFHSKSQKCVSCNQKYGFTEFYSSENEPCTPRNDTAFKCSNGEYQTYAGSDIDRMQCISCAPGRFLKPGSFSASPTKCTQHQICPRGKYVNPKSGTFTKDITCLDCTTGKFNDKPDNGNCMSHMICPSGFIEIKKTREEDTECKIAIITDEAGFRQYKKEKEEAIPCNSGEYVKVVDREGTFKCVVCPPGRFTTTSMFTLKRLPHSDCFVNKTTGYKHYKGDPNPGDDVGDCVSSVPYSCKRWTKCRFNEYVTTRGTSKNDVVCQACNNTGLAWFSGISGQGDGENERCVNITRPDNNMYVWLSLAVTAFIFCAWALKRFTQRCCCPRQPIDPRDPKGIRKRELARRPHAPLNAPPLKVDEIPMKLREQRRVVTF